MSLDFIDYPLLESNDLIIEIKCCGICGTDFQLDACGNCSGDCSDIDPLTNELNIDGLISCSENAGIVKSGLSSINKLIPSISWLASLIFLKSFFENFLPMDRCWSPGSSKGDVP